MAKAVKKSGKAAAGKKVVAKKAVPKRKPAVPLRVDLNRLHDGATSVVLDRLFAVVMDRRTASPEVSHSARLLSRGRAKVAQKFGEEAVECLIEAVAGNQAALIGESADVLYHLIVLWVASGIRPDEVWTELQRREGISGVAEKAARTTKVP